MNILIKVPWWETALAWNCEQRLGLQRVKDRKEREKALLCCLTENWMEEGELQCGCPHITPPPPAENRLNRFLWIAAGLGWWAADVMLSPFQYVCSVCWNTDLPAAHDNCKCFVSVGWGMVAPWRPVWRPAAGTRGSSPKDPCGWMWPEMHGVLLGLVTAGPCDGRAAVWRWMPRSSGRLVQRAHRDPQGLAIDELCCGWLQVLLVGVTYAE